MNREEQFTKEQHLSEIIEQLKRQMEKLTDDFNQSIKNFRNNYLDEIAYIPSFANIYNFAIFFGNKIEVLQQPIMSIIAEFAKEVDRAILFTSDVNERMVKESFSKIVEKQYDAKKYVPQLRTFATKGLVESKQKLKQVMKDELSSILESMNQYWNGVQIEFNHYLVQYFSCEEDNFVKMKREWVNSQSLAVSQMIFQNPVLKANNKIRRNYIKYLEKYCRIGKWEQRKYAAAQLQCYHNVLFDNYKRTKKVNKPIKTYAFFLLFDFLQLIEYDEKILQSDTMKSVIKHYVSDFSFSSEESATINLILSAVSGNYKSWKKLKMVYSNACMKKKSYLIMSEKNVNFKHTKPFIIVVTATMSAGKSTFINALTGKNLNLAQNMACTSKIHSIIGKAYDDGVSYKYDAELFLMAKENELLKDSEKNKTEEILVSTYYNGILGGKRIIIHDSPGVNFSGEEEHKKITYNLIQKETYNLLIYILNATQLGTNDDEEHLNFVKKHCKHTKIIFVLNKIDTFNEEEEDVIDTIRRTKAYLEKRGFVHPVICPISAKAGYLAKKRMYKDLSRIEQMEFNRFNDKFEIMDLSTYYKKYLPFIQINEQEEEQLMKNCGLSYIETIIKNYYNELYKGGNLGDTSIC